MENIVNIQQTVRLWQLSETEISELTQAVRESVICVAEEAGLDAFASALTTHRRIVDTHQLAA